MKMTVLAVLMALAFNAGATNNNPPNECGNHGNNCQPGGQGGNSSSDSNSSAGAVGIGVGVGLGGEGGNGGSGGAGGNGGSGGNGYGGSAVGLGGSGGDSSSAVLGSGNSSNLNNNKAEGGTGVGFGGDQSQGQQQGQGQQQSNVGLNSQGQSSTNVSGSKSISQMALENSTRVDASSRNANQSSASGNTTATTVNVGGDSTLVERNAPPVFLGALTPTSCGGGFNAGGSNRDGAAAFGLQWVGKECRIRMVGDRFHAMGMVDSACEIYKTTKGFRDAAKVNPKLRDLDCTVKPEPAAVFVPVAPELAPRIPRG
jgi:hypothetical protein